MLYSKTGSVWCFCLVSKDFRKILRPIVPLRTITKQFKVKVIYIFPSDRNMWNYMDVLTLSLHALIFVLRIASIVRGGDPYNNRLLEVVNYFYGINTLLLVLRFSSILEASKTVGPLQLALCRMCLDLFTILIQFAFVIVAFSVAITMVCTAENLYLTPTRELNRNGTRLKG